MNFADTIFAAVPATPRPAIPLVRVATPSDSLPRYAGMRCCASAGMQRSAVKADRAGRESVSAPLVPSAFFRGLSLERGLVRVFSFFLCVSLPPFAFSCVASCWWGPRSHLNLSISLASHCSFEITPQSERRQKIENSRARSTPNGSHSQL